MTPTVAYLAPTLTALESTFVYDELLALEERELKVVPVSVHRASNQVVGHSELLERTHYLYDGSIVQNLVFSLVVLFDLKCTRALRLLIQDMSNTGCWKLQAWKLVYQFVIAAKLAKILLQNRCQHLHIHFAHVPTQIGMYAATMAGIPFTVMAHANDIFERGYLLKEKAERALKFLTISEHNHTYLLKLGLPCEKLAVVRCGVSFSPPGTWPVPAEKETYRIGTLGRLVEKKGVDALLEAVAGLPSISLSIAGDGPLRAELQALASDLGISSRVEFVGSLSHHAVANWMAGLDLFVLACKQDRNGDMDGIPVVLMEAMSQGVPVVSTRLSGIPELVIHEKTGLLAMPGDSDDLRQQIAAMLASCELRARLAHAAAAHVSSEFGQDVNVDRLLRHFGLALEKNCGL